MNASAVTETFDTYANGTDIVNGPPTGVWAPTAGYAVIDAGGVAGSKGLSSASPIFNWKAQPFQWSTLAVGTKVAISMDFKTPASGNMFDDDRVGWTVNADSSSSSSNQFALQLDTAGMECYWDGNRTLLTALTGIKFSTWYRFNVEYTKLTDTSAGIVGTLTELDADGNPTGTPNVGTIADTSAAPYSAPATRFTSTSQWPSFKNYNASAAGNADNASLSITLPSGNLPPTVAITSPANNATVGANFTIEATATDTDGIASVKFYDGATLLDTDTTFPYSYDVVGATQGIHLLKAVAEDTLGATAQSPIVTVNFPLPPISVGVSGSGTITFDTNPPASQWATVASIPGSGATAVDPNGLDTLVQTLAASGITATLGTVSADPVGTTTQDGKWNSNPAALRLTSRAGSTAATCFMATLVNTSGAAINALDINFTLYGSAPEGEDTGLAGYALYYSLTGGTNSWQRVGVYGTLGAVSVTNIPLSGPWADAANLYVLWVDDNGNGGGDGWYGFDDVNFTRSALRVNITSPADAEVIPSGTSVTASANVAEPGAFTDTVTFHVTTGGTTVATVSPDEGSPYTAELGILADGTYEIYATVLNSNSETATSATHTFTVASATATTTTLITSGTPTTYGQNVTFTATVDPVPTGGTVQFFNGLNPLGTAAVNAGVATLTTTTLGAGTNEITAAYSGYQTYEPSSTTASISQEVGKAELTVTAHNKVRGEGSANPPLTYYITGYQNGQNRDTSGVSGEPTLACAAVSSDPAGDYPITCDVDIPGMSADNYSFTGVAGTLSVVPVAAELAYEGFQYTAGELLAGQNGGSGFSGAWSTLETSGTGITVKADGLTFSNLLVSGGRVEGQGTDGGGKSRDQRNLAQNAPGQLYGSYLYRRDSTFGTLTVAGIMFGNPGEEDNDSTASFYASEWDRTTIGARVESNMGTFEGGTLIPSETFLVLFSSNLNNGLQTATMWVLNEDQFDNFKTGNLTEAALNAAAVGTGSSNVYARATTQGQGDVLDPVNNLKFMAFGGYSAGGILVSFDELRLSQTSLDDVTPLKTGFFFTDWSAANAPGQTAEQDHDNDGVENGIEYFMGETGSSFTTMPGLDATNTVSWPMDPAYAGTYEVQTSTDLVTWTNVDPQPAPSGGTLSYTLPTGAPGGKSFVRLLVTPTP
jgi:hypothetical protein